MLSDNFPLNNGQALREIVQWLRVYTRILFMAPMTRGSQLFVCPLLGIYCPTSTGAGTHVHILEITHTQYILKSKVVAQGYQHTAY